MPTFSEVIMTHEDMRNTLIRHLTELEEGPALSLTQHLLDEGIDPLVLIKDCEEAMFAVGDRYASQQYYLSGLIMAGEIFREVMVLTQPLMKQHLAKDTLGTILLGTVQGDIHDIGKSAAAVALRCYGFVVEDLGVDVSPERFLRHVQENPPDIVGLSGLITLAFESMKETIQLLRSATLPGNQSVPIVVGGTMLNERICHLVGADFWTTDAMDGVRICQKLMEKKRGTL
jgi:methanogenic corrinoid protein MtbC1